MAFVKGLVQLGVSDGEPLDRKIAKRTLNVVLAIGVALTLLSIPIILLSQREGEFVVIPVVYLSLYFFAFFLLGHGLFELGRTFTIIVSGVHYVAMSTVWPHVLGIEFYLVALAALPVFLFTKKELRSLTIAYAYYFVAAVSPVLITRYWIPDVTMSRAEQQIAYLFVLTMVTTIVAGTFAFYRYSNIFPRLAVIEQKWKDKSFLTALFSDQIRLRTVLDQDLMAQKHDEVTVLFADLDGFSALCEVLNPADAVSVLHDIFMLLDAEAKRHGVKKIKTIGDCYMVVTGVLGRNDGQADGVADFALTIPGIVKRVAGNKLGDEGKITVRVGISTGPVVSGKHGVAENSFDVWGETVKMANLMERSGTAGRIQVTKPTFDRLFHAFDFEEYVHGDESSVIAPTYFLLGRKTHEEAMNPGVSAAQRSD